jgi:mycofactocin precursor
MAEQDTGEHAHDVLLVEDVLVEEVSIDGMCGVY